MPARSEPCPCTALLFPAHQINFRPCFKSGFVASLFKDDLSKETSNLPSSHPHHSSRTQTGARGARRTHRPPQAPCRQHCLTGGVEEKGSLVKTQALHPSHITQPCPQQQLWAHPCREQAAGPPASTIVSLCPWQPPKHGRSLAKKLLSRPPEGPDKAAAFSHGCLGEVAMKQPLGARLGAFAPSAAPLCAKPGAGLAGQCSPRQTLRSHHPLLHPGCPRSPPSPRPSPRPPARAGLGCWSPCSRRDAEKPSTKRRCEADNKQSDGKDHSLLLNNCTDLRTWFSPASRGLTP